MKRKQKIQIIVIVSIVLLAVLFVPFELPYKIETVAKLMPAQQWILSRGTDGDIQTNTINHLSGINNSYQLTSFERGESMLLDISHKIKNGQIVEKGDTIGTIYSSSQQESLIQLNGELQVLKATLEVSLSGVKKTEVKEAKERLEMSKSEYHKQKKIVERLSSLLEKELIAAEDYQTASDELSVLEKAVNVREAELESSLSGEKIEEINMLKKQISAVENTISFLEKQKDAQSSIIAPFNGRLERSFSKDTLLVLSNFDIGVAFMPVAMQESEYIDEGGKVSFKTNNASELLTGVVQMKQPVMQIIGGRQCIMVLATVYNMSSDFVSGMITQAEINCGTVTLQTFLKRNTQI